MFCFEKKLEFEGKLIKEPENTKFDIDSHLHMNVCRFHSDAGAVSSSCPESPEKTRLAEKRHHQVPANFGPRHTSRHADDDLDKLADKFKSIQANLEDISKKTLTPVNSPRREQQKV